MYVVNAPFYLRLFYPNVTWNKSRKEKILYLTFDDGPIPEITPWILDLLKEYDIKATFFCVGENIKKHGEIYERLLADGHKIGNHTFNHLKGWETNYEDYIENVTKFADVAQTNLFRPPYAKATKAQLKEIRKTHEIVYWDVLSGDFDTKISGEKCWKNVLQYTKNGSIIVFHDNVKAIERLKYALPKTIAYFTKKGYQFDTL